MHVREKTGQPVFSLRSQALRNIIPVMDTRENRHRETRHRIKPLGLFLIILAASVMIGLAGYGIYRYRGSHAAVSATASPTASASAEAKVDTSKYAGTVLAETADAGQDYIDSTLFLGDSNTARFVKISDTDGKTFTSKDNTIGIVGMGIDSISTLKCMQFSTGTFTMPESVAILQPRRIIITFGTNNLSGTSTDATDFITRYTTQIKLIQKAYSEAVIIINSIPPIGKTNAYPKLSMKQINAYNQAIAKMCKDNSWKFLDSAETLIDESTGYAKTGYTIDDGLHLSVKGLEALFTYIRTHADETEDQRTKPLKTIPTVIGFVENLIQTNPLNEQEFTEDPSAVDTTCGGGGWYDTAAKACVCNAGYTLTNGTCVYTATPEPTAASTAEPTEEPTCGANATYNSDTGKCQCNENFEGDPNIGCTAIQVQAPAVSTAPAATPAPTATASTEAAAPAEQPEAVGDAANPPSTES